MGTNRVGALALLSVLVCLCVLVGFAPTGASESRALPRPSPVAQVVQLQFLPLQRATDILRRTLPQVRVQSDARSNSLVLFGSPDDVQSARAIVQGIDVKNPTRPTVEVMELHVLRPLDLISRVKPLYPHVSISSASKSSVLLRAAPMENAEIKALITSLDVAPPTAAPVTPPPIETVALKQARPRDVARAVAHEVAHVQVSVSGGTILISGDSDAVARAKALAQQLDVPAFGSQYTIVYRLKNVDATSVTDLVQRSYPNVHVQADKELNSIAVTASASEQQRIGDAIAQLDGAQSTTQGGSGASLVYGDGNIAVVELQAPMPGQNNAPSTTAQDIATAVTQSLGQMAPDLRVTVPANSSQIILAGSPSSIRLARDLIARLDTDPQLVELDTEVYEVDDSAVNNVGLQLPQAVLSTTFSEVLPTPQPDGEQGRIGRFQPITRTQLQLTAQLNLLVQKGHGRVLADPRIATLSGHTATIRAGDQLNIITTTGGGVGTPVTQQLQTFNTGVTLDITPMVSNNNIIVALHPVVNSLSGLVNGVPQISTRDTQTTVTLRDNQTLVIGGLIQEADQKSTSSIPILGQIPFFGRIFRNDNVNITRNELVLVVTPHVLRAGEAAPPPDATMGLPTPASLPTLPPGTILPGSVHNPPASPIPTNSRSAPILSTPTPTASPMPLPTPSAFASTNVFEYGTAPQNTFAGAQDAPQIFYARFSPTVLKQGTPVTVYAVTTTNVSRVTIGASGFEVSLAQTSPSKWQATFPFSGLSAAMGQQNVQLTLKAYRNDGFSASIPIPVSQLSSFSSK